MKDGREAEEMTSHIPCGYDGGGDGFVLGQCCQRVQSHRDETPILRGGRGRRERAVSEVTDDNDATPC